MSKDSKKQKYRKNAAARSETVWRQRMEELESQPNGYTPGPPIIDEIQTFEAEEYDHAAGPVQDVITLQGDTHGLNIENPRVVCTCGWEQGLSESIKSLLSLGRTARGHAQATGHILRGMQ